MRARLILALQLLLLTAIPAVAQEDPCASSSNRGLTFSDFSENLSREVSAEFTASAKTAVASRANGDGITSNRLDLLKKAFLALDLGQVDQKDGDLVFNFNPDTLNSNLGQFSPRVVVHKTALFAPLDKKIDTLPESIRQNRKDTLKKSIGDLDDVEAHLRWTQASGTPRAALQAAASEIFAPIAEKTGKPAQELAKEIALAGAFFQTQLSKPVAQVTVGEIC